MTGYGSATAAVGALQASARMRSVNHRNLDMVLRLPEEYRFLEPRLREEVARELARGRVEMRLEVEDRRQRPVTVHVDKGWLEALRKARSELVAAELDVEPLSFGDLLRLPDALRISGAMQEVDDEAVQLIMEVVQQALIDLKVGRAHEGEKLRSVLDSLLQALRQLVDQIASDQPRLQADQAERLRSRIEEMVGDRANLDAARLEQEIAYLAERGDVREEIDRLSGHIDHFAEAMEQVGPLGKKLDFIAQEMARELSTLGAKCRHSGILQRNVDAKLICEQIREQVQNIE